MISGPRKVINIDDKTWKTLYFKVVYDQAQLYWYTLSTAVETLLALLLISTWTFKIKIELIVLYPL